MSEVTRILESIESGDHAGAEALLPLVYDELRGFALRLESPLTGRVGT